MEWNKIDEVSPDAKFDHNEPDAKLFLITDGKQITVAWYVEAVNKFGSNGVMYTKATHWCDIPPLPAL